MPGLSLGGNTFTLGGSFLTMGIEAPVAAFSVADAEIGQAVRIANTSTNATSYKIEWGDGSISTDINSIHRFRQPGNFAVTLTAFNAGVSSSATHNILISDDLLPWEGAELLARIDKITLANSSAITAIDDLSGHARHLASASGWTFQTNVQNGKPVIRGSGADNAPFTNNSTFTMRCGFIVAKYNGANFDNYRGLITDLGANAILVGNNASSIFFDFNYELFEFRANDRIYAAEHSPAPVNAFAVMFFRYWENLTLSGICLGQDRANGARRWNGDIAAVALYSKNFQDSEVREYSQKLANFYGLALANVFPFLGEYGASVDKDKIFKSNKAYDGTKVVRVKTSSKRSGTANFTEREQTEFAAADRIWETNYPATPVVLRDYGVLPPVDINAYITSKLTRKANDTLIDYSFDYEEV